MIAMIFSFFFYLDEIRPAIYFREFACILFAILVIMISYRYWIKAPVFSIMKKMSFELYLYHGLMITALKTQTWLINNRFIYGLLVIIFTVVIAYLIKIITNFILKQITKIGGNLYTKETKEIKKNPI